MFGRYRMEAENGEAFDVAIPAFSLDTPGQARTLN
jgi:ApaG protein